MKGPGAAVEFIGMVPPGGERLIRETVRYPSEGIGLAGAGLVLQGGGIIEGLTTKPAETVAQFAGMYLTFEGLLGATQYGTGVIRNIGREFVPIEEIGYEPSVGYPKSFRQTVGTLTKSFERGTLIPRPSEMSISKTVPYVPEMARLPGEAPGEPVLWTAWEGTHYGRTLELGVGHSEIPGMFGAPIAETYFTKVGGQMPDIAGFDINLFRRPSIIYTKVADLIPIPQGVRGSFADINAWLERNIRPGAAYLPMMKAEYEAVVPTGNILEVTGSRFYTKVGGLDIFGKKIFQTRIPIFETTVGAEFAAPPTGLITNILRTSSSYYRPSSIINIPSLVSSLMGTISSRSVLQSSRDMVSRLYSESKSVSPSISRISVSSSLLRGSSPSIGKSIISSTVSKASRGYSYGSSAISYGGRYGGYSTTYKSGSLLATTIFPVSRTRRSEDIIFWRRKTRPISAFRYKVFQRVLDPRKVFKFKLKSPKVRI
jgi:hypothetical protein